MYTEPFTLSASDRASPVFLTLIDYYTHRLQILRCQNDGLKPEAERCHLIGQIHEVKAFLKLAEDPLLRTALSTDKTADRFTDSFFAGR